MMWKQHKTQHLAVHYLRRVLKQLRSSKGSDCSLLRIVGAESSCSWRICTFEYPMARAFIIDAHGIATKIKNTRGQNWRSDASISCPNCNHSIDNSQIMQDWPGLPAGVKFDPTDQQLLTHLEAKLGIGNAEPHPLIDEFILTLNDENGICSMHPENLPGTKQDGSMTHVFYKTSKAYATGQRKRRKITGDVSSGVHARWHPTGTVKPIQENGKQKGFKKIMVLYTTAKVSKEGKTNWVIHEYHLGTQNDEITGEFVVAKLSYQQHAGNSEKADPQLQQENGTTSNSKADPLTPNADSLPLQRSENTFSSLDVIKGEATPSAVSPQAPYLDATTHQDYKGKGIELDKIYLEATYSHYPSYSADVSQFPDSQDFQFPDSQEFADLLCPERIGNQAFQGYLDICMPYLSECGRIGGSVSESRQGSVEAGNSIFTLSENGCIGNNEPETGSSRGIHEPERELTENFDAGRELDQSVYPELENILLDTPPEGLFTFPESQDSQF